MTPPTVHIRCRAGGEPFAGAWVQVTLSMRERNDYRLLFGPADDDGAIHIPGHDLLARSAEEADLFPMDYLGFPEGWTGHLVAEVLDLDAIERFRSAAEVWSEVSYRPESDPDLKTYEQRLRLVCEPLTAEIASES